MASSDEIGTAFMVDSISGGAVLLTSKDSNDGVLQIYDKSNKLIINASGSDETGGFLVTLNKDGTITNSVGEKSTATSSTYQKKVIRTRSIDLDRYKLAPGNKIR